MMKRLLLLSVAMTITLALSAQSGFGIESVFQGKIVPSTGMNETYIEGSQLAPYKLRTFRSVKFKATEEEYRQIVTLLQKDAEKAEDRQTEYAEGDLIYALFRFQVPVKVSRGILRTEGNKYLCLQADKDGSGYAVTLVYMAGNATLEDLKKIFNKKQ